MKIILKSREIVGRKVKNIRKENIIPANIYGPTREPKNVVVSQKEFDKIFHKVGYSSLIDAEVEGEDVKPKVLVKDVQTNPVKGNVIHVSFYQVDMTKPINADIPIIIEGLAPAVKSNVGILVTPINSIDVRCLPADLPASFTIDVSNLSQVGDSIKISDVNVGKDVELGSGVHEEQALAYIAPPQKRLVEDETPTVAADGETPAEGAEGKVEATPEKKEE